MKKIKTTSVLLAALLMAPAVLSWSGCKKKVDNSANTIEMFVYDAGYGTGWLDAMIEAFSEKYPQYNIPTPQEQQASSVVYSMVTAGPSTTTDLFIVGEVWDRYIDLGSRAVNGYEYCLEPLDDVYNYTPKGETQTIGGKMWEEYRDFYRIGVEENGEYAEHYYAMPWAAGLTAMMYNSEMFVAAGLKDSEGKATEPRTSDELAEYSQTLLDKGYTPFIYSAQAGYWEYMFWQWWAQYETLEGVENFYMGRANSSAPTEVSAAINNLSQQGILESLRAIQKLIQPNMSDASKDFVADNVEGLNYTTMQTRFFNGNGAMMPCGDWLENEMKSEVASSLEMPEILPMQTPVVSALSYKLSYWEYGKDVTYADALKRSDFTGGSPSRQETYDGYLRALVDYADGKGELPTYADAETVAADAKIVEEARSVRYSIGMIHSCAIPAYATAKEGAKEFLRFMASDEGLEIYMKNTYGANLPYEYDYDGWMAQNEISSFAKRKYELYEGAEWLPFASKYATVYLGQLNPARDCFNSKFEIKLGSRDTSTIMTPEKIVENNISYFSGRMQRLLQDSKLI